VQCGYPAAPFLRDVAVILTAPLSAQRLNGRSKMAILGIK
jgi:hypothetical protein